MQNQIVNAFSVGRVVYARRIAGTTSSAEPAEPGVVDRPAVALGVVRQLSLPLLVEGGRDRVEDQQRAVERGGGAERRRAPRPPRQGTATSATPVTSRTGSGAMVGSVLVSATISTVSATVVVDLVQPGHHLVEVVERVGVHGLGDVLGAGSVRRWKRVTTPENPGPAPRAAQ